MQFSITGLKNYVIDKTRAEQVEMFESLNRSKGLLDTFLREMSVDTIFAGLPEEEKQAYIEKKIEAIDTKGYLMEDTRIVKRMYRKAALMAKDYLKKCTAKSTTAEIAFVLSELMRGLLVTRELRYFVFNIGEQRDNYANFIAPDNIESVCGELIAKVRKDMPTYSAMIEEWERIYAEGMTTIEEWTLTEEAQFYDEVGYEEEMLKWIASKKPRASVSSTKTDSMPLPLDKVNSNVWGQSKIATAFYASKEKGETTEPFTVLMDKRNAESFIVYDIDFDNLPDGMGLSKKLTPYDKRVHDACGALWDAIEETEDENGMPLKVVTAAQVYEAMGNKKKMSDYDKKKIDESLIKLIKTVVTINTENEGKKGKEQFKLTTQLLPGEVGTYIVNGQVANSAVRMFAEPTLLKFARSRNELSVVPIAALQTDISQTEDNLVLEDYLLRQISHIKDGKMRKSNAILLETVYEKTGMDDKHKKSRGREKIRTLLEHYKDTGLIAGYTMGSERIVIELPKK